MLNRINNRQGFTLIELLIVVAIIGILAAVAIPQFSAYRMRGFNSAALSDLRNLKTAEESLYADSQCYGANDAAAALLTDAVAAAGAGVVLTGPMQAAVGGSVPVAGGRISGRNASGAVGAIPIGASNGVNIRSGVSVDPASNPVVNAYNSYVIYSRHNAGDTAYGSDSDNTTVTYRVMNSRWAGNVDNLNTIAATVVAVTIGVDNFNGQAGGGIPTPNWTIM